MFICYYWVMFYILATSKVISGRVPNCNNAYWWQFIVQPHWEIRVTFFLTLSLTDLSGKELHIQVGVDRVVTSGSLGGVMVNTMARNAIGVASILALGTIFRIFIKTLLMLKARLGSDKYQFCKSFDWLDWELKSWPPAWEVCALPIRTPRLGCCSYYHFLILFIQGYNTQNGSLCQISISTLEVSWV